jgi:hypothetical protein
MTRLSIYNLESRLYPPPTHHLSLPTAATAQAAKE